MFHNGLAFRRQHGLKNRFVVMYSGNMGLAHPTHAILAAAKKLHDDFPEIVFVMVGDGSKMSHLRSQTDEAGLNNVRFLASRQRGQLAECLAAADVHLACMHNHLLGLVVPSKVYGVLAAARPCIFLGPEQSEVARLIRRHRCGAVLDPGDHKGLADQLVHWFANREQWQATLECAHRISTQVTFETSWIKCQSLLDPVGSNEETVPPMVEFEPVPRLDSEPFEEPAPRQATR
jgi:glycosyltransferase involved in cell wall biosynthesis